MWKTDEILDIVTGVAVRLKKSQIELLDNYVDCPNRYKREQIILKPTDLGPIYKEPIFAEVYFVIINSPTDYLKPKTPKKDVLMNPKEVYAMFLNIYLHNRLKQYDADAEVETFLILKVATHSYGYLCHRLCR